MTAMPNPNKRRTSFDDMSYHHVNALADRYFQLEDDAHSAPERMSLRGQIVDEVLKPLDRSSGYKDLCFYSPYNSHVKSTSLPSRGICTVLQSMAFPGIEEEHWDKLMVDPEVLYSVLNADPEGELIDSLRKCKREGIEHLAGHSLWCFQCCRKQDCTSWTSERLGRLLASQGVCDEGVRRLTYEDVVNAILKGGMALPSAQGGNSVFSKYDPDSAANFTTYFLNRLNSRQKDRFEQLAISVKHGKWEQLKRIDPELDKACKKSIDPLRPGVCPILEGRVSEYRIYKKEIYIPRETDVVTDFDGNSSSSDDHNTPVLDLSGSLPVGRVASDEYERIYSPQLFDEQGGRLGESEIRLQALAAIPGFVHLGYEKKSEKSVGHSIIDFYRDIEGAENDQGKKEVLKKYSAKSAEEKKRARSWRPLYTFDVLSASHIEMGGKMEKGRYVPRKSACIFIDRSTREQRAGEAIRRLFESVGFTGSPKEFIYERSVVFDPMIVDRIVDCSMGGPFLLAMLIADVKSGFDPGDVEFDSGLTTRAAESLKSDVLGKSYSTIKKHVCSYKKLRNALLDEFVKTGALRNRNIFD